jgi:type II secretory pathway pseudopilin PulG
MKLNERGMSIPELVVVMVVTGIMVGAIMSFAIDYQRYGYLLEADLDTLTSRLNAGDYIREGVGTSTGLITQNGIPDPNPNSPDPADATNQYWKVIHAIPGTITASTGSFTPVLYYKRLSINTSGQYIMNNGTPYEDEYVIYLNGTTKQLLARSIANPAASGNRLKTSCPPPGSVTCPADKVIADDMTSVVTRYFSRSGNAINYTSITDPATGNYIGPDFPVVDVVEIKLNLSKKSLYQKTNATNNSTTIRIALRNT